MYPSKVLAAAVVLSSAFYTSNGLVLPRDDGDKSTQTSQSPQGPQTTVPPVTTQSSPSSLPTQSTQSTKTSESSHVSPTQSSVWTQSSSSSTGTQLTQTTPSTWSTGSTQSTPPTWSTQSTSFQASSSSYTTRSMESVHPSQSSKSVQPPTTSVAPQPSQSVKPPQPAGAGASCDGILGWQPNTAYTAGNQTVYMSELWTAKQWSYNNPPKDAAMEWTLNGPCSGSPTPKPNVMVSCVGIATWNRSALYDAGSKVTYNTHLWYAPHWASSNTPGDKSGAWVDQGACSSV
ncbi:hypothetical protein BV22DRAFT_1129239 [Leucogyrophana mollusca]|uniref:Uncharacterized protein n=1 Tax=Leucogyrophana mollusca TaxID=85980 RepID=A0ACB8BIN7_9AGAM|nr:hypothetical protein BV22DRAFT_1129239 [Leucogyrophana mollusca]